MVCENPYTFGDGLNIHKKRELQNRIMTAQGARSEPGRLDYYNGSNTTSLPNIGASGGRIGL